MKAAPLAAMLLLALAATGATAQAPTTATSPPVAATTAAPSEPKVLNAPAPKPAEKPAAAKAEPYAGQKPVEAAPQAATAAPTPAPSATAATNTAPAATAPATEGAATAAKAAAAEAKSAAPVSEGPAVKPIGKSDSGPATAAKSDAKADAVPTLAKPEPPKPTLHVAIDLTNQKMSVNENGGGQFKWSISSGRTGYLTPKGTFRPVWMSKMWYSRKYDYAPMPHAIFFHGGAAIHGTDSVYALGRPASHGCVRLSPSNAATLYRLVTKHGKQKTQITVFGTPKQTAPMASADDSERRPRTTSRSYENEPWWNDDDSDYPPVPSRRVYSDRYDDRYERPRYRTPRQRRYVRDYDSYGDDF